ncbi:MAG: hypothetical protein HW421_1285 [Ignavibacteria bacterium]|nr:hypothetical protein [Ignavibacteria bacterium]
MKVKKVNIAAILINTILIVLINSCGMQNSPLSSDFQVPKIRTVAQWYVDTLTQNKLTKINFKEYDKTGKLLHSENYSNDGILKSQSDFSYDNNAKFEAVTFFGSAGQVDSSYKLTHILNNNGKVEKETKTSSKGDTLTCKVFDYDNKGNVVKETIINYSENVKSETKYSYVYNNNGYLNERITNLEPDGKYSVRDSLTYTNDKLTSIKVFTFNSSGSIQTISTYSYNTYGFILYESIFDISGKILKKIKYEYTYY